MSGRLLAIILGVIILIGAAFAARTIRLEKEAHFARAAALEYNLAALRKAIYLFHADQKRYPHTLEELVPKYLRRIPVDPVTRDPWKLTTEQTVQPNNDFTTGAPAKSETYIIEVHSSASGKDANGVPFADY